MMSSLYEGLFRMRLQSDSSSEEFVGAVISRNPEELREWFMMMPRMKVVLFTRLSLSRTGSYGEIHNSIFFRFTLLVMLRP